MKEQENYAMWAERVAAWHSSGESMRAFALRHEWKPRQLAWWNKRINEDRAAAPVLIPVKITSPVACAPIRLNGSGWSLELPVATPADWLAELLRSL
ncbi:MAG: hypothetical protein K2X55_26715 [Burkholderiaceae bacterium]|nr:hypothetical protein [Burkholderiaceae bacterium]